jgi:hypothetical protein
VLASIATGLTTRDELPCEPAKEQRAMPTQRCARCSARLTKDQLETFNRVCSGFLTMDQYEQVRNVVADSCNSGWTLAVNDDELTVDDDDEDNDDEDY